MARPATKSASPFLSGRPLPDSLVNSVLNGLPSPGSRQAYAKGIADLQAYAAGRPITLTLLQEWRLAMLPTLAASTINVRLCAVRALVRTALRRHLIDGIEASQLSEIEGVTQRGVRTGHWLTVDQVRRLLAVPPRKSLRGSRNYCILAVLVGCALRVDELARLELQTIQQRDGRWVLSDLTGKGGRVRTVAIPAWTKTAIDGWLRQSQIKDGRLIRQLTLKPEGLSTVGIRDIVRKAAQKIGVTQRVNPHDLRRTCARLCREAGGDIEQIQAMLGHASINTTQRYLGTVQNLRNAVNDNLGI